MSRFLNRVEMRSQKYAARQYVSESHDHKPDAPMPKVMVLDEGTPAKRLPMITWSLLPSGQWLKIVRDQRLHLNNRIYRVELYDKRRVARVAIFRRSTEATR